MNIYSMAYAVSGWSRGLGSMADVVAVRVSWMLYPMAYSMTWVWRRFSSVTNAVSWSSRKSSFVTNSMCFAFSSDMHSLSNSMRFTSPPGIVFVSASRMRRYTTPNVVSPLVNSISNHMKMSIASALLSLCFSNIDSTANTMWLSFRLLVSIVTGWDWRYRPSATVSVDPSSWRNS